MFAGKPAQKVSGLLLGITTLTVLHVCILQVALTNVRQGPLAGVWLWAAALITAAAGLLHGGFSPVRTSEPRQSSAEVSQRGRTRPRGALLLCWLAFAIFVVTNLVSLRRFLDGSFPRGLSRGISFFVVDEVVIPALLAMAPIACIYAGARAQQFTSLALVFLGLLPVLCRVLSGDEPVNTWCGRSSGGPTTTRCTASIAHSRACWRGRQVSAEPAVPSLSSATCGCPSCTLILIR